MRYLILLAVSVLVVSCTTPRETIPSFMQTRMLDLTPYAEEGFLITPEAYEGRYESVGPIFLDLYPGAQKREYIHVTRNAQGEEVRSQWAITEVDMQSALDSLYDIARRMGADGIMNFRYDAREHPFMPAMLTGENRPNPEEMRGVHVEGFAIRRVE